MRFINVFRVWLIADLFLAITGLLVNLFTSLDEWGLMLTVIGYGVVLTLPSLAIMIGFHTIYTRQKRDPAKEQRAYVLLVVYINLAYIIVNFIWFNRATAIMLFYLITTIAGLAALFLEFKRINKKKRAIQLLNVEA